MTDEHTNKFIPPLRFHEFINDGEWNKDAIENIFSFLPNNTLSRAELNYNEGITKNVHYGDVLIKFGDCLDVQTSILPYISDKIVANKLQRSKLQDGDVIIADTAEDETAGKCTELLNVSGENVVSGLHTIPIRPKKRFAVPYLGFYFNSDSYRKQLLPLMQGVKVLSISKTSIGKTFVSYPILLSEQSKIGLCLSSVDAYISVTKKKVEQLKAHKKGLMQKLFPTEGNSLPQLRFKEFEKDGEWVKKSLGKVAEVFQGYGFPEKLQGKTKGKYPFIKVSDISVATNKGSIFISNSANYIDEEDLDVIKARPFPTGTIVFAKIGEAIRLNKRAILKRESLIDNNVAGVKATLDLSDDEFLYHILVMIDLAKYAGGVVPAVKKTTIEEIEIFLPPTILEQRKIASCIAMIDKMINHYSNKAIILENHKKGMMQQLFPSIK